MVILSTFHEKKCTVTAELRLSRRRGSHAPLYCVQSVDKGKFLFEITSLLNVPLSFINLSDFCRLQIQCAICKFSMSLGCPPFDTGMMWSIQGLIGCGALRLMSIGLPQIPQTFSDLSNLFLFLSKAARCGPCLSVLILSILIK